MLKLKCIKDLVMGLNGRVCAIKGKYYTFIASDYYIFNNESNIKQCFNSSIYVALLDR